MKNTKTLKHLALSILMSCTIGASASIIDRNPPVETPVPTPLLSAAVSKRALRLEKLDRGDIDLIMFGATARWNEQLRRMVSDKPETDAVIAELKTAANGTSIANLTEAKRLDARLRSEGWKREEFVGEPYESVALTYRAGNRVLHDENIGIPGTERREAVLSFVFEISIRYSYVRADGKPLGKGELSPHITEKGETLFRCTLDGSQCWNSGTVFNESSLSWRLQPNYERGGINSAGGG